jgi:hypothetical protein
VSSPLAESRGVRRAPVVILVIVAIAAAVAAGRADAPRVVRPAAPVVAAQLPVKGAISTAWFCPGLPKVFPIADQTVTLTNIGARAADTDVTVHPDDGSAPVTRTVTVRRDSVRTFKRSLLPNGPLVVEPFSSDVVVSAGLETGDTLTAVPCASTASTDWYFAAGTTVRGVSQWLVLEDPFAADARVDVTLRTETGLQLLPSLSGLDVPRRSRVVIPIHDEAVRRERVSVEVHASVGQVVASETVQFRAESGPPGVATSIGAVAPGSEWWFTGGDTRAGASSVVAIADLGQLDARVNVQAQAGAKTIVHPVELTVPSGGVSWVQVGGCSGSSTTCLQVPSGTGYVLVVQSDAGAPIVAQTLTRFGGDGNSTTGAALSTGSTTPARRWVIPRTRAIVDPSRTSVALTVSGVDPARVSVAIVHGGRVDRPAALRLTIAPGERVVLPLGDPSFGRVDAAVVVRSDVPIFAESTIYTARGATRAPGIPSR